jgi:ABC-type arginine/histidine transport system permease subunit
MNNPGMKMSPRPSIILPFVVELEVGSGFGQMIVIGKSSRLAATVTIYTVSDIWTHVASKETRNITHHIGPKHPPDIIKE